MPTTTDPADGRKIHQILSEGANHGHKCFIKISHWPAPSGCGAKGGLALFVDAFVKEHAEKVVKIPAGAIDWSAISSLYVDDPILYFSEYRNQGYYISEIAAASRREQDCDWPRRREEQHLRFQPATIVNLQRSSNESAYEVKLSKGFSTYIVKKITDETQWHWKHYGHELHCVSHVTLPGKFEAEGKEAYANRRGDLPAGSTVRFKIDVSGYAAPDVMGATPSPGVEHDKMQDGSVVASSPIVQQDQVAAENHDETHAQQAQSDVKIPKPSQSALEQLRERQSVYAVVVVALVAMLAATIWSR